MSAYDTIDVRPNWTVVSFVAFGAVVLFLLSLGNLARMYRGFHFWSLVLWTVLPGLSLLGSASGLVALWRGHGKEPVRSAAWALILNATVFLSCVAAILFSRLF